MARSVIGAVLMCSVAAIIDTRGRKARCGSWAWTDIKKAAYKEESYAVQLSLAVDVLLVLHSMLCGTRSTTTARLN